MRKDADPDPLFRYYWNTTYIDAPLLRHWDSDTDGTVDGTTYYLYDASFNVTALANLYGEVLERHLYDPYGAVSIMDGNWDSRESPECDNDVLFQGRPLDAETGLYDFRHRMYHPTLGRWMQSDPLGYVDGMGLYEFEGGRPAASVDPWGMAQDAEAKAGEPPKLTWQDFTVDPQSLGQGKEAAVDLYVESDKGKPELKCFDEQVDVETCIKHGGEGGPRRCEIKYPTFRATVRVKRAVATQRAKQRADLDLLAHEQGHVELLSVYAMILQRDARKLRGVGLGCGDAVAQEWADSDWGKQYRALEKAMTYGEDSPYRRMDRKYDREAGPVPTPRLAEWLKKIKGGRESLPEKPPEPKPEIVE